MSRHAVNKTRITNRGMIVAGVLGTSIFVSLLALVGDPSEGYLPNTEPDSIVQEIEPVTPRDENGNIIYQYTSVTYVPKTVAEDQASCAGMPYEGEPRSVVSYSSTETHAVIECPVLDPN